MEKKEFRGSKKIGRFHISGKYVRENPDEVAIILNQLKFIPVRVEHLFYNDEFLMEGLSEKFEEKEEGYVIPFYDIIVNVLDTGDITVSVKKQ